MAYGGDELLLRIGYHRERFDDDTIHRMLGHLRIIIEAMPIDPLRPIANCRGSPLLNKPS